MVFVSGLAETVQAAPILAGPVFLKVKNISIFLQKVSNKEKCYPDFWTC